MKKTIKSSIQSDSKKADEEIEKPEVEIVPSEEIENDEILDIEDDQDEETPGQIEETANETETVSEPEVKPIPENSEISNKSKIKALKRSVDNKMYSIEREESKVKLWRIQAADRDKKATDEYEKRKSELEVLLKKNQERFDKRMAKTKKWWHEFSDNYTDTKIKKLHNDLTLLQSELSKFESLESEPEETK
jgi:hypothetical protein